MRLALAGTGWPPAIFWVPGTAVALMVALPVAYLLVRAAGAGASSLELATSPRTLQLLLQTAALAGAVTGASTVLGVAVAWLVVRCDLPLRRFWSVILALPLVIPTYVGGFTYVAALGPRGLAQQILEPLGVERLPEIYGFWGATLVLTVFTYPYVMLPVGGVLLSLDPRFERASQSLGAGPWQTFIRVTLPLLQPAAAAGALLVMLYTLSDFGAVSLLQFDSLTRAIYLQYQGSFDRTLAAVLGLILVLLTVIVLVGEGLTRGAGRYYHAASGVPERPRLLSLGPFRWAALAMCAITAGLGVVLPMAVLLYWLGRGILAGVPFSVTWGAAAGSAGASVLAAAATVLAAVPVAVLAARYRGPVSAGVERVTYLAFALPGIVVALALVFFAANYAPLLYQTLPLLILAYLTRFLPEAVGSLRGALLQVSPRVEEAARSLGRDAREVLLGITIPLAWPGAIAGAALVFLSAMKELPVTLLLSPIGFKTLATVTWSAASAGFFAQAALPALLLVLVSAASLLFLLPRESRALARQARE